MTQFIQVAVPTPLRRLFDYLNPDEKPLLPGVRVRVPFGKARELIGIVVATHHTSHIPAAQMKSIIDVLDTTPIFNPILWQLCAWLSEYYHHPLGEVLHTALPILLRQGKALPAATEITHTDILASVPLTLNADQAAAVAAINQSDQFSCFLLDGITGSGKTEVYLQAIAHVLAQDRQALVLVPEIALTPQTIARFTSRFSKPVYALHSGLTERQRLHAWQAARTPSACIVIGTRSALFTPLAKPGIIIVDEEHDISYKQQDGFRYHARDAAIYRAHLENIPIVLGSATPSLESAYNAERKRYQILHLPERAGTASLPQMHFIDMRKQPLEHGISKQLLNEIKICLDREEQVLLFINRRGYAKMLLCHDCGYCARCHRCDSYLTLHQKPTRLLCHHCLHQERWLPHCAQCGSQALVDVGTGTEKIEQYLQTQFSVPILRIDSDSTRKKGSLQLMLDAIQQGHSQILLGTQMLAKGHHFPNVTLVAILDCDSGLYSTDFRATERMGQLILQVAGRAGRANQPGKVLLQTHHPEHPLLRVLLEQGYSAFVAAIAAERKQAHFPPFAYSAILRAEATKQTLPMAFLKNVQTFLHALPTSNLNILGPVPTTMERVAGRFRAQLLFLCPERKTLHHALSQLITHLTSHPERQVRWYVNVDPMEIG